MSQSIESIEAEAHALAKAGNRLDAIKTIRQALGSLALAVKWADTHYPKPPEVKPLDRAGLVEAVRELRAALAEMLNQFGHYCEHTEDPAEVAAQAKARAILAKLPPV